MFDKHTYVRTPDVNVRVENKQQPNDAADAARLYGECVKKAEEAVLGATIERLGLQNEITVGRIDSATDFLRDKLMVRILFSINGVDFDWRVDADPVRRRDEMYKLVSEVICQKLYHYLIHPSRCLPDAKSLAFLAPATSDRGTKP